MSITPIGCYNENPKQPALPKVFYNEANPGKPNFAGSLLQWSNYFKADFKTLLCKCAHLARSNKWGYFGVREIGRSKATDHEIGSVQERIGRLGSLRNDGGGGNENGNALIPSRLIRANVGKFFWY